MISSEVQRTLVKSPPELWAELSDPDALARHLGELGEIRITRVEPEQKVEWEAQGTTGTVLIKPSGWGTRVTLSVSREVAPPAAEGSGEAPEVDGAAAEPDAGDSGGPDAPLTAEHPDSAGAEDDQSEPQDQPAAEERPADPASDPEPADTAPEALAGEPAAQDVPAAGQDVPPAVPSPAGAPRRGFWARFMFFLRGPEPSRLVEEPRAEEVLAAESPAPEPSGSAATGAAVEGEPPASTEPEQQHEITASDRAAAEMDAPDPECEQVAEHPGDAADDGADAGAGDVEEELRAAQESASEHVTAVLTGVLDRLGAAHHRPFSRA